MQLDDGKGRRVMGDVFHCPAEERKGCKERVFEMFYRGELEAWVDERDFAGVEEVPDAIGERDGVDDDGGVEVPDAIGERDGDDDVGGEEVPDFVGKRSYYDCDDDIEVH